MAGAAKPFHICPLVQSPSGTPHTPPTGSAILPAGQNKVMIENQRAIVQGDTCICVEPGNSVQMGSRKVFFGGRAAARMGDPTTHPGGRISQGSTRVIIG